MKRAQPARRVTFTATSLSGLARSRKLGRLPKLFMLPRLFMLTDERRVPDPLPAVAALPRGAGVILRHYDDPGREALAWRLARLCRARGLVLLIAGDARLALAVGADGLHLPEALASQAARWRRLRPHWIVTAAAHTLPALLRGAEADALLLSPVFPTASHPGARPLGILRFAALARRSAVPVYALGGVDNRTLRRLRGSECLGVAAIGALSR